MLPTSPTNCPLALQKESFCKLALQEITAASARRIELHQPTTDGTALQSRPTKYKSTWVSDNLLFQVTVFTYISERYISANWIPRAIVAGNSSKQAKLGVEQKQK
jgi:hypothetical protein